MGLLRLPAFTLIAGPLDLALQLPDVGPCVDAQARAAFDAIAASRFMDAAALVTHGLTIDVEDGLGRDASHLQILDRTAQLESHNISRRGVELVKYERDTYYQEEDNSLKARLFRKSCRDGWEDVREQPKPRHFFEKFFVMLDRNAPAEMLVDEQKNLVRNIILTMNSKPEAALLVLESLSSEEVQCKEMRRSTRLFFDLCNERKNKAAVNKIARSLGSLSLDDFIRFARVYQEKIADFNRLLQENRTRYIEDFIRGMMSDPFITYPFSSEDIRERLSKFALEALDPLLAEGGQDHTLGNYRALNGTIGINVGYKTGLWHDDAIELTIFHEFLHALSGHVWHNEITTGEGYVGKLGLKFAPPDMRQSVLGFRLNFSDTAKRPPAQRMVWLNEAVTEYLALRIAVFSGYSTTNESNAYYYERCVLKKMLDAGIPLQVFVDAYFESVSHFVPENRMPAYRKLSRMIREVTDDGWLVRVDGIYQNSAEEFRKFAEEADLDL